MSKLIKTNLFEDFESAKKYSCDWNEVVPLSATCHIYQTFEWNRAWWNAFGKGQKLILLIATTGGKFLGAAPFALKTKWVNGIRARVASFIGAENYASDYCDFIAASYNEKVIEAFLEWFYRNSSGWTILDLSHIPEESKNIPRIEAFFGSRKAKMLSRRSDPAPTLLINSPQDALKAARKKSLKRHYNYFKKTGQLEFLHLSSANEIKAELEGFFSQHIDRWRDTPSPSQFLDPRQKKFYYNLVAELGESGLLRFAVVRFNGVPIAYHFGFEYLKRFTWYKPSFNIKYKQYSPGEVLLKFLLEDSAKRGLKEFDFAVGDETFKRRFANLVRYNHRISVYNQWASYFIATLRNSAKRFMR